MTEVLLIGGDQATQEAVAKGLAKFDQIFQKKTIFDLAKNYAIALNLYEERKHKVIFLAKEPSKEEINFIVAAGVKWSQNTTIFAQKKNASLGKFQNTSEKYFMQLSKKQILKLYKMYEMDFLIGGYPYPQRYIDLGY